MRKLDRKRLLSLGVDKLADLLIECADSDRAMAQKLLLLTDSDTQRLKKVRTQLAGLKRIRQFHDWKSVRKLREKISLVLQAIDALEIDAKQGFELVIAFFETDAAVIGNCDDSNGLIAELYRFDAKRLLLKFGSQVDDKDWLQEQMFELNQENAYGVRDCVLAAASEIMPESASRQLIERYFALAKAEDENTPDATDRWMRASRRYWSAAQQLAAGIKDGQLHELATCSLWGEHPMNAAGWNAIAEVYLEAGNPKAALEKLANIDTESSYQRYETEQLKMLAHKAIGTPTSKAAIRNLLRARLFDSPSSKTLGDLGELLSTVEQSEIVEELRRDYEQRPKLNLSFLAFALEALDVAVAEDYLLQRAAQLNGDLYSSLVAIAKEFVDKQSPLAATLILRALADSILQRGASTNYKIAVGYIVRAEKLAASIADWQGHPDHATYLQSLRDNHARKTAFWSKMA